MSRIYFHSEHGDAEVRGSERAYMGVMCSDIMMAAIGDLGSAREWLVPLLPADCYVRGAREGYIEQSLALYLRVGMRSTLKYGDERVDAWIVSLETALVMGGDALKLMARLHGQCEVHCYVEGKNREWLAGIIESGRSTNVLRANQGWEETAKFLKSRSDAPVVCSYSVCDQFPNYSMLPESHPLKLRDDEERLDAFYVMPKAEAWSLCLTHLRTLSGLELRPDDWNDYSFGPSIFDVRNEAIRPSQPSPAPASSSPSLEP